MFSTPEFILHFPEISTVYRTLLLSTLFRYRRDGPARNRQIHRQPCSKEEMLTRDYLDSELAREKMWARIHLTPLLQAEEDRDQVRRYWADQAREKELLGENRQVYHTDKYVDPFSSGPPNASLREHHSFWNMASMVY